MRKFPFLYIFLLIILLSSDKLSSQTWLTYQKHGGYVGATLEVTRINNKPTFVAGGKAIWMFNGKIGMGGAYFDIVKRVESNYYDDTAGTNALLQVNYGGLALEYNHRLNEQFEIGLQALLGGGGMKLVPKDKNKPYRDFYGNDFLVWIPAVNLSYKLNPLVRINLSGGYRIITGFRPYFVHSAADFSDYTIALSLKFGDY